VLNKSCGALKKAFNLISRCAANIASSLAAIMNFIAAAAGWANSSPRQPDKMHGGKFNLSMLLQQSKIFVGSQICSYLHYPLAVHSIEIKQKQSNHI
jgi:hypothetical protein